MEKRLTRKRSASSTFLRLLPSSSCRCASFRFHSSATLRCSDSRKELFSRRKPSKSGKYPKKAKLPPLLPCNHTYAATKCHVGKLYLTESDNKQKIRMKTTRRPQLHKKIPILSRDTLLLPHPLLKSRINAITSPKSENTTDTKDITTYINQTMGSHVRTRKSKKSEQKSERPGEKLEPKLSRRISQIYNNPNNSPQT